MNVITPAIDSEIDDSQKELSPRQLKAVASLLNGANYQTAADASGSSLGSIRRWICLPEFKAALAEGRKQALETAVYDLADGCSLSVKTLKELMRSAESETVRCRAAEAVLNSAMKLFELHSVVDRVTQLEILIGGTNR